METSDLALKMFASPGQTARGSTGLDSTQIHQSASQPPVTSVGHQSRQSATSHASQPPVTSVSHQSRQSATSHASQPPVTPVSHQWRLRELVGEGIQCSSTTSSNYSSGRGITMTSKSMANHTRKVIFVWLHNSVVPSGQSQKFHQPWTVSFKVVQQVSD